MNVPHNFCFRSTRLGSAGRASRPTGRTSRVKSSRNLVFLFLFACLGGGFALRASAGEPSSFQVRATVSVDGAGIFADQVIQSDPPLAALRLGDAPAFGKATVLTRSQLGELLAAAAPGLAVTNWGGAEAVRIARRARSLSESDILALLTTSLQRDYVKDKGELELRFSRPWTPPNVPDEALKVNVLDLPTLGVTPSFIIRFEIHTERETVSTLQVAVQARVWRDVWTAHSMVKRGELVAGADLVHERRDVVNVRESLAEFTAGDASLEFAESVQANALLLARTVKPRTVVRRGQMIVAQVQEGALNVSLKVEALEDGAPGQSIRVRNPISRRDLSGKVLDEQTVLIPL